MENDVLISRAAAIDALTETNLKRNVDSVCDGDMNRTRRAAQRVIAQLPAVDAAPVVRCERCVYYNTAGVEGQGIGMCHCLGITVQDGFFCAFGQEKSDDEAPTCGPDYCEIGGDDDADG